MKKMYLLAALAATLTGCATITKHSPKDIYKKVEKRGGLWRIVDHLEVTDTKFIMGTVMGEQATDFKVEDGYIYAGPDMAQVRFKIVGPDTLQNKGALGYEGVYVRVG